MKRLFLLRHAQAVQANKDTPADADRPLTDSGRQDAAKVGRYMREEGYQPDLILCSPSVRTRQTLEQANAELRASAELEYVESIYNATAGQLLSLMQGLAGGVMRPMLVGHNPGFEELAALLVNSAGAQSFADAPEKDRFPTAALAVMDFDISRWSELSPHNGVLADFAKPGEVGGR
jgi:phosphohistidine phosphatase